METGLTLFGATVALSYIVAFTGVLVGPGWLRRRRQAAARLQIALTDAIDRTLGPLVTPVVRKPLVGPWRVEISVPFRRPGLVGRILAVTHETLAVAEGLQPGSYRIILAQQRDAGRPPRPSRVKRTQWAGGAAA
jgi:hypothetical protein